MVLARILSTEGPYLEAQLEVAGQRLVVMDEFSVDTRIAAVPGADVEFEFTFMLDEQEDWESIFSGNPERKMGLDSVGSWKYRAFGRILNVDPVIVDCGLFKVEGVIATHDEQVVGSYIAFTISRLGGYAHTT